MAITGDGLTVKGIGTILSEHVFLVPTNQRSYMWEEEHVSDYWNDILNAMASPDNEDYFIGTIVLSKTDGDELEIVDGQQRLATTAIIYAAIRNYFSEGNRDEKRAKNIERNYLVDENEDTLAEEPHLSLNEYDDTLFQEYVIKTDPDNKKRKSPATAQPKKRLIDSHKCIIGACETIRTHLYEHLTGVREDDKSGRLMRNVKYIREHVKVICVTVPSHENAYTIFETLNDRGLDLTKADLLKNHLLRTAGKRVAEAQTKWAQMLAGLETVTKKDITVDYIRYQ